MKNESAVQGLEKMRHSINPNTPTPQNQPMEGRKRENSKRQKERADYAIRKALATT